MIGKLQACTFLSHVPLEVVIECKGMLESSTFSTTHDATHKIMMVESICNHGFHMAMMPEKHPHACFHLAPRMVRYTSKCVRYLVEKPQVGPATFGTNNFANKSFFYCHVLDTTFGLILSEWERPLCHLNGPHVTNRLHGVGTSANHGYFVRNGLWVDRNSSLHKTCNKLPNKKLT